MMRPVPDAKVETWFRHNDADIWISTIVLAEIAFGIERLRPAERSSRLAGKFSAYLQHFSERILPFDRASSLLFGGLMGEASRNGRTIATLDGMIAATALRHKGQLATRNTKNFASCGLDLINPWS